LPEEDVKMSESKYGARFRQLMVMIFLVWLLPALFLFLRWRSEPQQPVFCNPIAASVVATAVKLVGILAVGAFLVSKQQQNSRNFAEGKPTEGFRQADFPIQRQVAMSLIAGAALTGLMIGVHALTCGR